MNLRGTGIREGSLSILSQLTCLRYLDVSGNRLSEIAIPVFLETALVDNNELKKIEISCFTSCPHRLNTLSLKNNKLTELPKQMWQLLSLQNISFSGNNISMLDFSFTSCGSRLVKFEGDGNPFDLMPPAVTDLLMNNRFSEACEMSIKPIPVVKIAVLSKANGQTFDSITRQLCRISMVVNIQEKGNVVSKTQWTKTLLVATLNPPRLFFLNPDNDSESILEARLAKDKAFWDISNPAFKFIPESGGRGTVSFGTKSGSGSVAVKPDVHPTSKIIDFFSVANRCQWDQYLKALAKLQSKNDRRNIFFKSIPGFLCQSAMTASLKSCHDFDPSTPVISPLSPSASPRIDPTSATLETEVSRTASLVLELGYPSSQTKTSLMMELGYANPTQPSEVASIFEQQVTCNYNSFLISAPIVDMNFFLPTVANSDIVVVNMVDEAMTQSDLFVILSGIKFVSRKCPGFIYVIVESGQYSSISAALGNGNHDDVIILVHQAGNDVFLIDRLGDAVKLLSAQKLAEPFADYFQSFILGVMTNRPPWTEPENMIITFSELWECIRIRRSSLDALGTACISYLEDGAYDMQQFLLQSCVFLDKCGVLVLWNSHISDPIIICNLDMFAQDVMIPLLHFANQRHQSPAESRIILSPQDRAHLWPILPTHNLKLMSDMAWALVSLQVLAVTLEAATSSADLALLSSQPLGEPVADHSSSTSASSSQIKEGYIHTEDGQSHSVKKQWFTCSVGSDGISVLTWRNTESLAASQSTQSILFAKGTKTTVSLTKKNRPGFSHCCRLDYEDPRASAKKTQSTKIVMCFNTEKEMREWWAFIELSRVPQLAIKAVETRKPRIAGTDSQPFNVMFTIEDAHVSKESKSSCSIFQVASESSKFGSAWLGCVVRIDAASEYIMRSVLCSMSLYIASGMSFRNSSSILAVFKRQVAPIPTLGAVADSESQLHATAVLAMSIRSAITEVSLISSGHECHVLADLLLEALARTARTGSAQCTISAIEDVPGVADTYGLSSECYRPYFPSLVPSFSSFNSFTSLLHRPSLSKLRRIVHVHSKPLKESSDLIEKWSSINNWEYSKYNSDRTNLILAAETAAASEQVVLILEVPFVHFRGR